jgi:hypothetical protein
MKDQLKSIKNSDQIHCFQKQRLILKNKIQIFYRTLKKIKHANLDHYREYKTVVKKLIKV